MLTFKPLLLGTTLTLASQAQAITVHNNPDCGPEPSSFAELGPLPTTNGIRIVDCVGPDDPSDVFIFSSATPSIVQLELIAGGPLAVSVFDEDPGVFVSRLFSVTGPSDDLFGLLPASSELVLSIAPADDVPVRYQLRFEAQEPAAVPLPASLPLLLAGLIGAGALARRRVSA